MIDFISCNRLQAKDLTLAASPRRVYSAQSPLFVHRYRRWRACTLRLVFANKMISLLVIYADWPYSRGSANTRRINASMSFSARRNVTMTILQSLRGRVACQKHLWPVFIFGQVECIEHEKRSRRSPRDRPIAKCWKNRDIQRIYSMW